MSQSQGHPIRILSIEDNPADVRLIRELFKTSRIASELFFLRDGAEALSYLLGLPPYQGAQRPDLILLDLNLPKKDGREVLREIKAHPDLAVVPVLVLTTSDAEEDIIKCYELHANSFITKPAELERFSDVMDAIEEFWLATAALPTQSRIRSA
jgi:CheY-like chemotaxis protein